jgi:hypothetical protein
MKGNSFRLVARKGTNGITNYDSSDAIAEETAIYDSIEAAFADIRDNAHDLSDFKKPETYLSYEKLQEKLRWVTFSDASQTPAVQTVAAVSAQTEINAATSTTATVSTPVEQISVPVQTESAQEQKSQSLDDMLQGLI